jgi:hypothetical protein
LICFVWSLNPDQAIVPDDPDLLPDPVPPDDLERSDERLLATV